MKIVYMGTPDFAQGCLKRLYDLGHEITGVFCQPDKPQGRKMVLTPPPVKVTALELGLNVFQPATLRTAEAEELIRSLEPELIVVVAYGKILPENILAIPEHGCINVHASVLPLLRGAAPIQWSVINGFKETGVTTMLMDKGLDTGDILLCDKTEIGENETSEELWDRLSLMAPDILEKTIKALLEGELKPEKQNDAASTYAPLLSKELGNIDWSQSAQTVHNRIRGLYSWPCAYSFINGKKVKLLQSVISSGAGTPGEVLESSSKLVVACGEGAVEILRLQAEGKKAMSAADYLRGNPVEKGSFFNKETE